MAKDVNSVSPLCGTDDVTGLPVPIQLDPVTGRVLAELYIVSSSTSTLSPTRSLKDVNSVSALLGLADDSSGLLVPVIDHRNGYLYADLLQE